MNDAKYRTLVETLKRNILSGRFANGNPFPSVRSLIRRYGLSNTTVLHALDELVHQGLISRKQGSGTFVTRSASSRKIGLIVPGIAYSEFFAPIVSAISHMAQRKDYALVFGDAFSESPADRARQVVKLARDFAERDVSGVIFQPVEFLEDEAEINKAVIDVFRKKNIPVVLLDSDIVPPPDRSGLDVVGIDNFNASGRVVRHLVDSGSRRIAFLMRAHWAPSVRGRLSGVRDAVIASGLGWSEERNVLMFAPGDERAVKRLLRGRWVPDAIVCGDDLAAVTLCKTIARAGYSVPGDVKVVGFNDVMLAGLASPSLTTVRQPCAEIAKATFARLLARMENPNLEPILIALTAPLVIRTSTFSSSCTKTRKSKKKGKL